MENKKCLKPPTSIPCSHEKLRKREIFHEADV
jgi:hypothetical protein